MEKKLILSIDEAVLETAKAYVEKQGISLSRYVESYLKESTGAISKRKPEKKAKSKTPNVDAITEIQKRMRSPEEQEKYLQELYRRKPHMKELFEMLDKKYGY